MAAHERLLPDTLISSQTLLQKLAPVLPKDYKFTIYHLSTPPTKTSSLYSAPPDTRPDRTYCESHFLAVSIDTEVKDGKEPEAVLVFAIEILIYSTAYDTTFFVSKADSTGYLHLLGLPKGTPSPIREISVTFIRHLIERHDRPGLRTIISLFARAQDQYLFPGSVEYSGKHVLDDRGLVKWWCRVLDPLIQEPEGSVPQGLPQWDSVKGYLIVPGLDTHETLSCVPRVPGSTNTSWIMGHPLQKISRHSDNVPPRCIIPHYPDDPKARFLDELDEEITKAKNSNSGHWKSVRSVDQFWDMMAYRQECSSGRMVGFIWIVFEPKVDTQPSDSTPGDSQGTLASQSFNSDISFTSDYTIRNASMTPATSFNFSSQPLPTTSPTKYDTNHPQSSKAATNPKTPTPKKKKTTKMKPKKLSGPIIPREPRIKTQQKSQTAECPGITAYYVWHPEGRGQVVVEESAYKRINELLLRLDFANIELATSSTRRWVSEVRSGHCGNNSEAWGQTVTGTRFTEVKAQTGAAGVNTLNMGLVRKKRKAGTEEVKETPPSEVPKVNVLSAGMIRKKAKA